VDRWTILKIKEKYLPTEHPGKCTVIKESTRLEGLLSSVILLDNLTLEIRLINEKLWLLEEKIRSTSLDKDVGGFASLGEQIHIANDERSRLKAEINKKFGCEETEVKFFKGRT
jgi:hypothetical protein